MYYLFFKILHIQLTDYIIKMIELSILNNQGNRILIKLQKRETLLIFTFN